MTKIATLMTKSAHARHFAPRQVDRLSRLAGGLVPNLGINELKGDVEVLLTSWGSPRLTGTVLKQCPNLKLIAHCGGSVRRLMAPELFDSGVRVTSNAAVNAIPVAEFALSWILRWNKHLPYWERVFRGQHHDDLILANSDLEQIGNHEKTVGIISASQVGRHLISLLQSFSLSVRVFDPFWRAEALGDLGAEKTDLTPLLSECDIVVLAAPLLPATRGMIGDSELALMKDGALLINVARGGLVDHDALLAELRQGRISAVLDVTEPEPLPANSAFFDLPNAWVTPHVAGSLGTEIHRLTDAVLDEVELFLSEGRLRRELTADRIGVTA